MTNHKNQKKRKNNNAGKIIFAVLVISVLFFTIFSLRKTSMGDSVDENDTPNGSEQSKEEAANEILNNDQKVMTEASQSGNPEKCKDVKNEILQRSCFDSAMMVKARLFLDPRLCQQVISPAAQRRCIEEVEKAVQNKN